MRRMLIIISMVLLLVACGKAYYGSPGTITFTDGSTRHCSAINTDNNTINCFPDDYDWVAGGKRANQYPANLVKSIQYEETESV